MQKKKKPTDTATYLLGWLKKKRKRGCGEFGILINDGNRK
jgi:hypothetical protein